MKSGLAVMLHLLDDLAARRAPRLRAHLRLLRARGGPLRREPPRRPPRCHFPALRGLDLAVCLEPSSNELQLGCMGSLHARVHLPRPHVAQRAPLAGRERHPQGRGPSRAPRRACAARRGARRACLPRGDERHARRGRPRSQRRARSFHPQRQLPLRAGAHARRRRAELTPSSPGRPRWRCSTVRPRRCRIAGIRWCRACSTRASVTVEPKQAWTDVARFAAVGVAAVNLGPGTQSQAHQRNEWTDRAALAEGMALFRRWLFAGAAPGYVAVALEPG
jgi:succinyl-diaminopimelate desuccinylase